MSPPPCCGDAPCVKRRRIRGKGGDVNTAAEPLASSPEATAGIAFHADDVQFLEFARNFEWPDAEAWQTLELRAQRQFLWDAVKNTWCKMQQQMAGLVQEVAGGLEAAAENAIAALKKAAFNQVPIGC